MRKGSCVFMKLAICDDNDLDRELLSNLLHKYFAKTSVKYELTQYSRGMNLYYDVTEGFQYDIIFLDLFMEDSFGMSIAQKLREIPYNEKIIFCTSSSDYALESYGVFASGYIVKPYGLAEIKRTLDLFIPEFETGSYKVKQKCNVIYIPFNEIIYVESSNSKCILHRTENRTYTLYKQLRQIEAEINDERFLRCHQSYLVNMNYISEANDTFVLKNGEDILIRKKDKKEIHRKFSEYKEKTYTDKGRIAR